MEMGRETEMGMRMGTRERGDETPSKKKNNEKFVMDWRRLYLIPNN